MISQFIIMYQHDERILILQSSEVMAEYLAIRRQLEDILNKIFSMDFGFAYTMERTNLKSRDTDSFKLAQEIAEVKTSYDNYHGDFKQCQLMSFKLPEKPKGSTLRTQRLPVPPKQPQKLKEPNYVKHRSPTLPKQRERWRESKFTKQRQIMPPKQPENPEAQPTFKPQNKGNLSELRKEIQNFTDHELNATQKFFHAHKTLAILNELPSDLLMEGLNLVFESAVSIKLAAIQLILTKSCIFCNRNR